MPPVRFRFDHAVIVVDSLHVTTRAFQDAGFTVTPGGRHDALPTENALVAFADGSYLELLAFVDPDARGGLRQLRDSPMWAAHLHGASAIGRRFLPRLAGLAGVGDTCLAGARLEGFAGECRRRDTPVAGPVAMTRERENAEALAWSLLLPADDTIPFFIEDRTPREWRVPGGLDAIVHANGATGIAEVFVRATSPVTAVLKLADLFDAELEACPDGRALARFAGVRWWLEEGAHDGAFALGIHGPASLPEPLLALGVRPATEDDA
jgi:hypothetical protein